MSEKSIDKSRILVEFVCAFSGGTMCNIRTSSLARRRVKIKGLSPLLLSDEGNMKMGNHKPSRHFEYGKSTSRETPRPGRQTTMRSIDFPFSISCQIRNRSR